MDKLDKYLIVGGAALLVYSFFVFKPVFEQANITAVDALQAVNTPISWLQGILNYSAEGWKWAAGGFKL